MELHGDDAAQSLAAFGGEPAFVLGNSGGAQIGLNLAARYPGRVNTLVAHEPPCIQLLPDGAEERSFIESVYETYRTAAVGPAMQISIVAPPLATLPHPADSSPPPPPSPP